jgi:hypothetical protein
MGIPIGTKFGKITTIDKPQKIEGVYKVKCRCECGVEKYFQPSSLRKGIKGCRICTRTQLPKIYSGFKVLGYNESSNKLCVEFECLKCKHIETRTKATITGKQKVKCPVCKNKEIDYYGLCITHFKKIQSNAIKRKIEFDLDREYLGGLFKKQNCKCALTGVNLNLVKTSIRTKHNQNTASLDRIDNNKGYIKGNVRWVHKVVNQIKSDLEDKQLFYICKLISNFNKDKITKIDINQINQAKKRAENAVRNMIRGSFTKKAIEQYNLEGKLIKEWDSINGTVRELNYKSPFGIIACCKGRQKSFGGYIWKYKDLAK